MRVASGPVLQRERQRGEEDVVDLRCGRRLGRCCSRACVSCDVERDGARTGPGPPRSVPAASPAGRVPSRPRFPAIGPTIVGQLRVAAKWASACDQLAGRTSSAGDRDRAPATKRPVGGLEVLTRILHETPSTARWWMTRSSRPAASPQSKWTAPQRPTVNVEVRRPSASWPPFDARGGALQAQAQ